HKALLYITIMKKYRNFLFANKSHQLKIKCYLASSSAKPSTKKDLPQEVYYSPQPDHVPLWKRNISNKLAVEYRKLRVNKKGTPISTVVVRIQTRNRSQGIRRLRSKGARTSAFTLGRTTG
uniref:Uncharacterized protein n=1 Tax=Crocodylus porosus TaxID=8502 RepID=A0A7M4DX24_CROPO